jgi:hypothetical protein
MYYHFDYRGGPISYEWINQTPLPKIWDNMTKAYDAGIREIWIVNVGDLKPMEFPLDYFMALAYDYETWKQPNKTADFTYEWAKREFGAVAAKATASVISRHTKILGARKAEVVHYDPPTFSLTAFDESNRVIKGFEAIVAMGEKIYEYLPEHKKAAFFQMVLYPARAAMNVYKTSIYAAWNHHYAKQGSPAAADYARMAEEAWRQDAEDMEYFNTTLSHGKWDGIMRQNHMRYTTWDGSSIYVVKDELPELKQGDGSPASLCHSTKQGDGSPVMRTGLLPQNDTTNTYLETSGYVSINPARFVRNTATEKGTWTVIDDYGREFDSVKVLPNTVSFAPSEPAPTLEYRFHLQTAGDYNVNIFILPINNPYHFTVKPLREQLRFSIQLNDGELKTQNCVPDGFKAGEDRTWGHGVMNNVRVIAIPCGYLTKGLHKLNIIAVDAGVVIQKIVIAPPEARQVTLTDHPPTEHFMDSYLGPPESCLAE